VVISTQGGFSWANYTPGNRQCQASDKAFSFKRRYSAAGATTFLTGDEP